MAAAKSGRRQASDLVSTAERARGCEGQITPTQCRAADETGHNDRYFIRQSVCLVDCARSAVIGGAAIAQACYAALATNSDARPAMTSGDDLHDVGAYLAS
jgi:hypothetical protein